MTNIERFTNIILEHLKQCVRYRQSNAIRVYTAKQNLMSIMAAITQYVAEIEDWGVTDYTSFNAFEVAKQRLYLSHSILIEVVIKPISHPDYSFIDLDLNGFNKVYFDLELNQDDPYFDTIKRDYYNDVSS